MQNLRLQNILPPKFDSEIDCIRTFFTRFETYRDSHIPPWDDEITLNILCNLVDDSTLLFLANLHVDIHNNFLITKERIIHHFESGKPLSLLWNDLINRKQGTNESIISYYNSLLILKSF